MHPKRTYLVVEFLVVTLATVLQPGVSCAQPAHLTFEHYTVEQGLSAPVNHIAQDRYGFLWLGTTDGLNRFDGNHFVVYRNIPGDTTSLANNIINALHVDHQGRVWAATNRGLCYYDYADDQFHTITFDASLESLDQYRVHAVCSGSDGSIWFATRTTLHNWTSQKPNKTFPLPYHENLLIKYLYADAHQRIWVGSNAGLHILMDTSGTFLHSAIKSPFSIENHLEVTIHPIVPFQADTLWMGTWYADLQKVFLSGDSIVSATYTDIVETDPRRHIVSGIAPGIGTQWWIGTYGNGLALFDTKSNRFIDHFHHNPSDARSLSDDYINDVFTDVSGIVWIGTSKGLDKFDPLTQQFQSVTIPLPPNQFAVYRLANTIVEDAANKDWLWLCVSGAGLYRFNKLTQDFDLYQTVGAGLDQLHNNNLYSYYPDQQGRVWVGTRTGMYLFNTDNKQFEASPLRDENTVNGAHTIFQDTHGHYWFATNSNGIYKFNEKENELTSYTHNPNDPTSIPDNKVFCMLQGSDGHIWIGTQNRGLCSLNPETQTFKYFEHDRLKSTTIPDNGVFDLYEDRNQHLWLATENGFAEMDLNSYQIRNYSTNDGLCNNTVFSITPDYRGHLWLATNNGLSHFDPDTKKFRNYYMNDGLPLNRIAGEVFFSSDGVLYFGTTGMLSLCEPEKMKVNTRIPSIMITDVSILGKKVPVMRDGEQLQPIHLSYKQNMITFNFTALNFSNAFLNQYAYKLDGFDETWIYSGNVQSATYTNLDGGTYTFHVKGANNDGTWNEVGTHALLYVYPPFWKTLWFYALCAIVIAGILYSVYRIRINQLIKLQNIRSRIARDLHDDIGSTLSSINMISSMADRRKEAGKKSAELFSTISNASSQALELMNDIVWSINPKNDRLEMILIRMRQYASEILEAADIAFTIEMDEDSRHILLPLEIRKDFYLIFKEAINNIAKYSEAKQVRIVLRFRNQVVSLMISDDGKGFDTSQAFHGNGLKNMHVRANQLRGQLAINSSPAKGTTIELEIPLTP